MLGAPALFELIIPIPITIYGTSISAPEIFPVIGENGTRGLKLY
jgi:hypothetical protein